MTPTLVTYSAMHKRGEETGMPEYSLDNLDDPSLLQDQGQHLTHILKAGEFIKRPRS